MDTEVFPNVRDNAAETSFFYNIRTRTYLFSLHLHMCPTLLLRHGVTESASSSLARFFSRIVETMLTDHTAICENSCLYILAGALFFYYSDGGFPGSSVGKESACSAGDPGLIPGSGKIPWRRKWQTTPVFLLRKSHGQRILMGFARVGHGIARVGHNLATKPPTI